MNTASYNILLVEDDPNDIILIKRAFLKAGSVNPVRVVEDGDAAVAYLAGENSYADRERYPMPALVLLDLKLPRRSGFEVLKWLRQQPGLKRLPVIILTASEKTKDINRAYDLGANSYLVKPVSFDDLLSIVKTLGLWWLLLNEKPEVPGKRGGL